MWLRSDVGRIVQYGKCPDYVRDSTDAELAAILVGLHVAIMKWPQTEGVKVYSDSTGAIHLASRGSNLAQKPSTQRLQLKIRNILDSYGVALKFQWVKGHRTDKTVKAYLNGICDRLAKRARKL